MLADLGVEEGQGRLRKKMTVNKTSRSLYIERGRDRGKRSEKAPEEAALQLEC